MLLINTGIVSGICEFLYYCYRNFLRCDLSLQTVTNLLASMSVKELRKSLSINTDIAMKQNANIRFYTT